MMIDVLLQGETELQVIPDYVLGELLAKGKVQGFRRSSGWVIVGRDPIRQSGRSCYSGPERRRKRSRSCLACPEMIDGECINATCSERRFQIKVFPFGAV
jgi:hypothetical protein